MDRVEIKLDCGCKVSISEEALDDLEKFHGLDRVRALAQLLQIATIDCPHAKAYPSSCTSAKSYPS